MVDVHFWRVDAFGVAAVVVCFVLLLYVFKNKLLRPASWTAARRLRSIDVYFWRLDVVVQGALSWLKAT